MDYRNEWNKLFAGHQEPYIKKARYLLDRGYIFEGDENEVAFSIWKKEKELEQQQNIDDKNGLI